jgi:hypothetical protein
MTLYEIDSLYTAIDDSPMTWNFQGCVALLGSCWIKASGCLICITSLQVGHNVKIGRCCLLCGQVGIGGSAE